VAPAARTALIWILVLTGLEIGLRLADVPSYILPTPSSVVLAFWQQFGWIAWHSWITVQEIFLGLALAVLCAVVVAVLIQASPMLHKTLMPLMVAAQASPKEAVAPLLVMWFGFTMLPKIILAAAIAFFPVLIGIVVGLDRFDRKLRLLAASMGMGPVRTFFSFRAWVALPAFMGALRVGITLAAVGAVLGEVIGSDDGIGYLVLSASRTMDGALLYASLVILVALSLGFTAVINRLERWLLPMSGAKTL